MKYNKLFANFLFFILLGGVITSCRKYLDVGLPRTQLTGEALFNSDNTAIAAMIAIYTQMEQSGLAYNILTIGGTAADELTNHNASPTAVDIATNNITPENSTISSLWSDLYKYVYEANAVIEGVNRSDAISQPVRRQLLGEAYFIRAYCHFYLLNFFGNIPYNMTTDYTITSAQPQGDASELLSQIIADLIQSKSLLSPTYMNSNNLSTTERVRPNKYAAASLLAKAYLFNGEWEKAEMEADSILQQTNLYSLNSNLVNTFQKTSPEVIWQLQPVIPGFNSFAGALLQPLPFAPFFISVSAHLVDSFEAGDRRRTNWITTTTFNNKSYHWLHKYKVGQNASSVSEFTTLIRLAEVFLVRAEARARQDKLLAALDDINEIRGRAGISPLSLLPREELLHFIYDERRKELFGEFADRWIDLNRTKLADTVMPMIKGNNWASTDRLFPIPLIEMLRHPGMVQNEGY